LYWLRLLLLCVCLPQIVPNFRVRTIPVLGTTPAVFGMAAAAHILCELAAAPFQSEPIIKLTSLQYDRALSRLQQREEEVFGNTEGVPVDKDDVSRLLMCFDGAHFWQLSTHICRVSPVQPVLTDQW
jgi:hypothetical protein